MNKLKTKIGLLLIAFLCAYTVDGISQSGKSTSKTEVVVIKKMVDDNGNETVEKKVFSGDDLTEEELDKLIEDETGSEVDVNIWKSDKGETIELSIDDTENMLFIEDDSIEDFLKEKGLSMDDIAEMNVNVESEMKDGKEIFKKTISVLTTDGTKHKFETEEADMDLHGSHEMKMMSSHKPKLGIMVGESDNGVLVEDVIADSPAHTAGLKSDDVIYAVGETNVNSVEELLTALENTGDKTVISYRRDGQVKLANITFSDFEYEGAVKKKIRKKMMIKKEEK